MKVAIGIRNAALLSAAFYVAMAGLGWWLFG